MQIIGTRYKLTNTTDTYDMVAGLLWDYVSDGTSKGSAKGIMMNQEDITQRLIAEGVGLAVSAHQKHDLCKSAFVQSDNTWVSLEEPQIIPCKTKITRKTPPLAVKTMLSSHWSKGKEYVSCVKIERRTGSEDWQVSNYPLTRYHGEPEVRRAWSTYSNVQMRPPLLCVLMRDIQPIIQV